MVVMTLPMTAISVFAAENDATEKNISLGTSAIANADRANSKWDRVYFGTYGGRQIKWLVLSTSGNGGSYTDANGDTYNASQNGALFILSEYALERIVFDASTNVWLDSSARTWAKETFGTISNFSEKELHAVLNTTKTDKSETLYNKTWQVCELNSDTFFFISAREAADYLGTYDDAPGLKASYYNGSSTKWWLRSPYPAWDAANGIGMVWTTMGVGYHVPSKTDLAARPAFNLNSSSVLFTSPAKGDKPTFGANADLESSEGYKLTLLDTSRSSFSAEILKTSTKTFVSYSGATTGEKEHITAMIVDASGKVTYYGSLRNVKETADASGTLEIDLSGMNSGDKLYILNEQWNGDYNSDYASALSEITMPTDVNAYDITFDNNGGVGTMDGIGIDYPEYTLPECEFTYEGYVFAGWSYTAGGEVIKENTITLTRDITLYAVWSSRSETIAALDKAIKDLDTAMKDGNANLSTEISNLNVALTNAKNALEAADTANKSELESKISTAQTTLQAAIDKVAQDLETAKSELTQKDTELTQKDTELAQKDNELTQKDIELTQKDSELQTFITVTCVISCVTLCGFVAFAIWFFVDKKKR